MDPKESYRGLCCCSLQNVLKVPNETSPKNGDPAEGRVVPRALVELKLSFPVSLVGKFGLVLFI